MRACASGKAELATILYHWNSAALHLTNNAGKTCAQLAGESTCPSLKEELEQLRAEMAVTVPRYQCEH